MESWRFLPYDTYHAAENMAIDEAIMIAHRHKNVPPTVRFYGWKVPTLSIGYFQKIKEINLDQLGANQFEFVRRLTGGRAVLHDQELTYSVILSEEHSMMSTSIQESYHVISRALVAGLQNLGLDAVLAPKRGRLGSDTAACFDVSSDYELLLEGKKIVGSAQTRQQGMILQHGSILMRFDVDQFIDLLYFSSEEKKDEYRRIFQQKAVAINDVKEQSVSIQQVSNAFVAGFESSLGIDFKTDKLTLEEKEISRQLIKSRYGSTEWTHRR